MLIKDIKDSKEKLKVILELIDQGKTQKEIAELGGYSRPSRIKEFLKNNGYIYNDKANTYQQIDENVDNNELCQVSVNSLSLPLDNQKFNNDLIDLVHNYEKIKEVLNWYKERDSHMSDKVEIVQVIQEGMRIDLPAYEGASYRASIRINPIIWEQFDQFANKYPQFVKADLIAQAMKEYMERYK